MHPRVRELSFYALNCAFKTNNWNQKTHDQGGDYRALL
jgi:hypothetical protein